MDDQTAVDEHGIAAGQYRQHRSDVFTVARVIERNTLVPAMWNVEVTTVRFTLTDDGWLDTYTAGFHPRDVAAWFPQIIDDEEAPDG